MVAVMDSAFLARSQLSSWIIHPAIVLSMFILSIHFCDSMWLI